MRFEALEDEQFAAIIEEAEKYLGYPFMGRQLRLLPLTAPVLYRGFSITVVLVGTLADLVLTVFATSALRYLLQMPSPVI